MPADLPPIFDPIAFFDGRTRGDATLKIVMRSACPVTVEGSGERRGGDLVLTQRIRECDKPERTRSWTMRATGDGRYEATTSDAVGAVDVRVDGPLLSIGYRTKGDIRITQSLRLARDGRSAQNTLTARKFGMVVARLDETIRRVD